MPRIGARMSLRWMMALVALAAVNLAGWTATWEQLPRLRADFRMPPMPPMPPAPGPAAGWPGAGVGQSVRGGMMYLNRDGSIVFVEGPRSPKSPLTPGKRWVIRGPTPPPPPLMPIAPPPPPVDFRSWFEACAPAALTTAFTAAVLLAPVAKWVDRKLTVADSDRGFRQAPDPRGSLRPAWGVVGIGLMALNVIGGLVSWGRLTHPPAAFGLNARPHFYARWCVFGAGTGTRHAHLHLTDGGIEFPTYSYPDPTCPDHRPDWPNHRVVPPPTNAEELWRILTPVAATLTITGVILALLVVWQVFRRACGRRPTPEPAADLA